MKLDVARVRARPNLVSVYAWGIRPVKKPPELQDLGIHLQRGDEDMTEGSAVSSCSVHGWSWRWIASLPSTMTEVPTTAITDAH